jgi:hypothetical protein
MGVASEVVEDLPGAGKGALDVGDPGLAVELVLEGGEGRPGGQVLARPAKVELVGLVGTSDGVEELATKEDLEGIDWEEVILPGVNPLGLFGVEAPAGDDAVQVGVETQIPSPGVQHGRDADLGAEPVRVSPQL